MKQRPTTVAPAPGRGFTVVELLITVTIVGVLASIAYPSYSGYRTRIRTQTAVQDLAMISGLVKAWTQDAGRQPDSLTEVLGPGVKTDPWGNPYEYLNLQGGGPRGHARKDHALVPINTDFDLYSKGPDGRSAPPLKAHDSRDDIVRANDGRYFGVASGY